MEAAALYAGLPHSDTPSCLGPSIIEFGCELNDALPDEVRSEALLPLGPLLVGTCRRRPNQWWSEQEDKTGAFFTRWAAFELAPQILRTADLTGYVEAFERAETIQAAEGLIAAGWDELRELEKGAGHEQALDLVIEALKYSRSLSTKAKAGRFSARAAGIAAKAAWDDEVLAAMREKCHPRVVGR